MSEKIAGDTHGPSPAHHDWACRNEELQTSSESQFDNSVKLAEELTAGLSSQITFSTASLLGENE